MSRSFALIKFDKTNNIYYGCYNGTSDILIPKICTPEECYDKEYNAYRPISYLDVPSNYILNIQVNDFDNVYIYSDYGGGFWWRGTGSESAKYIKEGLDPWNEDIQIKDEVPKWVQDFLSGQC